MLTLNVSAKSAATLAVLIEKNQREFQRGIKGQLRKAGNVIRRKQRALLRSGTKGPEIQTGRIVSQIRVVVRRAKGSRARKDQIWEAFIGVTPRGKAFYGKFFEHGAASRRTKAGASRGTLIADPFMKPALEATIGQSERIIAESFDNVRLMG